MFYDGRFFFSFTSLLSCGPFFPVPFLVSSVDVTCPFVLVVYLFFTFFDNSLWIKLNNRIYTFFQRLNHSFIDKTGQLRTGQSQLICLMFKIFF